MTRILIVDDEPLLVEMLSTMLSMAGYQVKTAPDANDAVKELKDFSPDLVVTDFHMPGMSGPALLQEAKRQVPSLRGMLITGYDLSESSPFHSEYVASGANAYLKKPFRFEQFVSAVSDVLAAA